MVALEKHTPGLRNLPIERASALLTLFVIVLFAIIFVSNTSSGAAVDAVNIVFILVDDQHELQSQP